MAVAEFEKLLKFAAHDVFAADEITIGRVSSLYERQPPVGQETRSLREMSISFEDSNEGSKENKGPTLGVRL